MDDSTTCCCTNDNNDQIISKTTTRPTATTTNNNNKELHIAPMIRMSNREFRELFRILTRRATLWTEMIVDETVVHQQQAVAAVAVAAKVSSESDDDDDESSIRKAIILPEHILDPVDHGHHHPIVCQIGGMRPEWTQVAARILACKMSYGYDEINLNLDCPSDRVQDKRFGAILMKYPDETIALLRAMKRGVLQSQSSSQSTSQSARPMIPVSVKCRIGVDEHTDFQWIKSLIEKLSSVCTRFILHARLVLLQGGLNPAQNRNIPPLNYHMVYRLCDTFPDCDFWINGGIMSLRAAKEICYGTQGLKQQARSNDNDDCTITHNGAAAGGGIYDSRHTGVPCTACSSSDSTNRNGSCTAPPIVAPRNLRGCMLGRAAMDHPAQFWDADRYFYGASNNSSNPPPTCTNRRQVLQEYCKVLERLYPRRCCDDCPDMTRRLPSPTVVHTSSHCSVCGGKDDEARRSNSSSPRNDDKNEQSDDENMEPPNTTTDDSSNNNNDNNGNRRNNNIKITARILDRSFRPFLGMFFEKPGAKNFRRRCFILGRDLRIRNCGPAFILQTAVLSTISSAVLDEPFEPTPE